MDLNKKGKQKPSGKAKIKELETQVANLEMATRISQMMLKQTLEQFQGLRNDIDNTMGLLNDFQYRTQAMLELGDFDKEELNKCADDMKLKDYMSASDAEDKAKGFELDNDGAITEDSIVIITSTTNGDEDKGIFRSKFPMSECHTETLKEKLLGKKVGDVVEEDINGDTHSITIVGLRLPKEEVAEGTDADKNESN